MPKLWPFISYSPHRRALTIKKIEKIDQITLEASKEDEQMEEENTVLAPNVWELLVLQREHIFY